MRVLGYTRSAVLTTLALLAGLRPAAAAVSAPVLKWSNGGCFTSSCQTGWYSSPVVADLDGDGAPEVIWGSYDVVVLSGATGALRARAANGSRVWPGIALADLSGNSLPEIIVGRGSNQLHVYRFQAPATLNVVWSRNPFVNNCSGNGCEVRTLAVEDLESDGQRDVIVGRASGGEDRQLNAYDANGNQRPGWPARRNGDLGYGWGMYNENVAVADMNGDGLKEVFGPTDTHYITALDRNGNQLPVNAVYTGRSVWSQVGVHVDHAVDVRGYAFCGTEHRPNFADSAPAIADVNGDGVPELIVVGNVYNCGTNPYTSLYHMPFILKLDRTRWSGSGFNWTSIPPPGPGSAPLSEDYNVIETAAPNAVVADLDGDGFKEILYSSYDGKVHAYWLDKTPHGSWPYTVPAAGGPDNFRFASEPVVADLDNDGHAEVLFTSWPQKATGGRGHLHVLDYLGVELHRILLPPALGGGYNGGLGAPTLANIDADADLEVVVGTVASGVVAYDLPSTASARVLWGTGRGSYRRTGAAQSQPSISIGDAGMVEGNAGSTNAVFTVSLSTINDETVTVNYATADGTAAVGTDYVTGGGTIVFPPGVVTRPLNVTVLGDVLDEPDETFFVNLSSPSGAVISDGQGVGTIVDDDTSMVSVSDTSLLEGVGGTTTATFTVSLSTPSAQTVTVPYSTADGTANAGSDYTATSGTVTFASGEVSQPVLVMVSGDTAVEPNETFFVNLGPPTNATLADGQGVGMIVNDDPPGPSAFAEFLMLGQVHQTSVSNVTPTRWLKVRLVVGRSYAASAWAPTTDVSESPVSLDLAWFLDDGVTAAGGVSTIEREPTPDASDHNGDAESIIPTAAECAVPSGCTYRVRLQATGATTVVDVRLMIVETTMVSPYWQVATAAGYEAAPQIRNNTSSSIPVTFTAYGNTGTVVCSNTVTLPANGMTTFGISGAAPGCGIASGFGSAQIAFHGPPGSITANITTFSALSGLSFDAPFTPRNTATSLRPN